MEKENYTGGIPTKIDVDILLKRFGVPNAGDKILYEDVINLLKINKKSNRWSTVTNKWREILYREHNVILDSMRSTCFICLNANERVSMASKKVNSGYNTILKGTNIAVTTDSKEIDGDKLKIYRHIVSIPNRIKLAQITYAKELD